MVQPGVKQKKKNDDSTIKQSQIKKKIQDSNHGKCEGFRK
jgi:hypothetical protein